MARKKQRKVRRTKRKVKLKNIYFVKIGRKKGVDIWVVDGMKIRREIYTDFVYGGNDKRYRFIPENEIWIDNNIDVSELKFTIAHELKERELMANGYSYVDAHEIASKLELKLRRRAEKERLVKEKNTPSQLLKVVD